MSHLNGVLPAPPDVPAHHFADPHTRVILLPLLRHHLQASLSFHSFLCPVTLDFNSRHPNRFLFLFLLLLFFCYRRSFLISTPRPRILCYQGNRKHRKALAATLDTAWLVSTPEFSILATHHHQPETSRKVGDDDSALFSAVQPTVLIRINMLML